MEQIFTAYACFLAAFTSWGFAADAREHRRPALFAFYGAASAALALLGASLAQGILP